MILEIDVTDEITPAIKRFFQRNPKYLKHLTKSVGWYFQRETKKGVSSGEPNGEAYKERIEYKVRKALSQSAPKGWYGKLKNAIGYEYVGGGTVHIGWTSATASTYGHLQERGFEKIVTPRMRRYWAHAGFPLAPNKEKMVIPSRPVFEPMTDYMRPKVVPYVNEKYSAYISENVEFGKKNRRKYKVYR